MIAAAQPYTFHSDIHPTRSIQHEYEYVNDDDNIDNNNNDPNPDIIIGRSSYVSSSSWSSSSSDIHIHINTASSDIHENNNKNAQESMASFSDDITLADNYDNNKVPEISDNNVNNAKSYRSDNSDTNKIISSIINSDGNDDSNGEITLDAATLADSISDVSTADSKAVNEYDADITVPQDIVDEQPQSRPQQQRLQESSNQPDLMQPKQVKFFFKFLSSCS